MSESLDQFKQALAKRDWEGMARIWQEHDLRWHAKEWKEFIEGIKQEAYRAGQKSGREEIKEKLNLKKYGASAYRNGLLRGAAIARNGGYIPEKGVSVWTTEEMHQVYESLAAAIEQEAGRDE